MTDQSIQSRPSATRPRTLARGDNAENARTSDAQKSMSYIATLDKRLVLIVGLLMSIGAGMVFSTTFNWSLEARGTSTAIFLQDHMRNVVLSLAACIFFSLIDYRFWRRFAPMMLLITIGALIAVLIFGDDTFGARRSLIGGRLQPGELAEFVMVLYMAAWLSAKRTRVSSLFFGFIPFLILLGSVTVWIVLQPDISSVAIILITTGAMYFLAGARIWHLITVVILTIIFGIFIVNTQSYAQTRVESYIASLSDPTQANYHTQQVITAFVTGGWFGKGLGQGTQKFNNALPAPHTDSIFAVIGEELGVLGASMVVLLFVAFVMRGFQIGRKAVDPFGALLATGLTLWVAVQALLNIAVMAAVVPSTGLPLPFISYGGSALMVIMVGVGLLLSINRVAVLRENATKRRQDGATYSSGWGNRRSRLSRVSRRRSTSQVSRRSS